MGIDPRFSNLAVQDQVIHSPSWGAAAFGPIYLLAMRAYAHALGLIVVIALLINAQLYPARLESLGWLPLAVLAVAWFASALGGKRVAWRTRRWRDFADFLACQRVWDRWGKGGLTVAAVLIALDWLLRTAAPPRGLRAREILASAIIVALGGAGAVATWWYVQQHRQRLHPWQRRGLRALAVASVLVCAAGVLALLNALYTPDAAALFLGASMLLAGMIGAVAAWQYGRRIPRRLWWLRPMLRLLVLPAAFVAAAGALAVLRTLRLPEAATTAVIVGIMALAVIVVAWPALWRDPQAAGQPLSGVLGKPPAPRRGVHLRTALDAVVLMARQPLLMLPFLVTVVIQGQLGAMAPLPGVPPEDPSIFSPQDLLRIVAQIWLVVIATGLLQTFAVAVVSHMAAQLELTQRISLGAALRRALIRLPALLGAYLVFFVRLVAGFLLLIIPGVVAVVRGALLTQAVILGKAGPFGAVRVSGELLRGHWWRMFFLLAVEFAVAAILISVLALGKVPRVGHYVATALEASWVAITLTLLYLRLGGPVGGTAPESAAASSTRSLKLPPAVP